MTEITHNTINQFTDVSSWLTTLGDDYDTLIHAGWRFILNLRDGLLSLGNNQAERAELYELAANHTGVSVKTLRNKFSLSQKSYLPLAIELNLSEGHVDAVSRLDDGEAAALLTEAAERSLSVSETRFLANSNIPDVGNNQQSINGTVLDENDMNAMPFDNTKSNILYEEADYSADADAYAGDVASYEYIDDSDGYTYTGEEFAQRMIDAGNRLRRLAELQEGWQQQRTQREWIMQMDELIY